jgi:hypothetical protein
MQYLTQMTQKMSKATEKTEKKQPAMPEASHGLVSVSRRSTPYPCSIFFSFLIYYLFICLIVLIGKQFTDAAGSN